jgi:hypothetical protein
MSHKQTTSRLPSPSERNEQPSIIHELSLLEGQHQLAIERRYLIQKGAAPLRRFSRNRVNEAELVQEA